MRSMRSLAVRLVTVALTGLLLLATACSGEGPARPAAGPAEATASDPRAGEAGAPKAAPDFTLATLDGGQVRLSETTGKVRLIDFWATWCVPCREEIPMLNELQTSYGDRGFQVMAISDADEELQVIREYVKQHRMEYLNLVGTEEVAEAFGVLGIPAAYLLDRDGRVIDSFLGPKPRRVLVKKIESLLDAPPST